MHSNSFMSCSLVTGYINTIEERPHSVYPSRSLSMKAILLLCLSFTVIILGRKEPYHIPYNYYDLWMVVGRNSSGQLYFNPTPNSRRVFIWKPYNASIAPTLFFENYPEILQDDISTTSSRIPEGIVSKDVSITSPATLEEVKETIPTTRSSGHFLASTPATAALELPPPGKRKPKNATASQPGMNLLQLHQSLRLAELMTTLNRQQTIPDLTFLRLEMTLLNLLLLAQTKLSTLRTKLTLLRKALVFITSEKKNCVPNGRFPRMLLLN